MSVMKSNVMRKLNCQYGENNQYSMVKWRNGEIMSMSEASNAMKTIIESSNVICNVMCIKYCV
jgi:hypothetical protein